MLLFVAITVCGLYSAADACLATSPGTTPAPGTGCNACGDPLPITGGDLGGGTIATGTWTFGVNAAGCKTAMLTCSDPTHFVTMDVLFMGEFLNLDQQCKTVTLADPVTCQADGTWQTVIQGVTIPDPQFACAAATNGDPC